LCQKIPVLKQIFSCRSPFRNHEDKEQKRTIGDHTIEVLTHLLEFNEDFQNLDAEKQTRLLEFALFHDVGKQEEIVTRDMMQDPEAFDEFLTAAVSKADGVYITKEKYRERIEDFFDKYPQLNECVVFDIGDHPTVSVRRMKKNITCRPDDVADFENLLLLVGNHQTIGKAIERTLNNQKIPPEKKESDLKKKAKTISGKIKTKDNLEMLRIFEISDAARFGNVTEEKKKQIAEFMTFLDFTCAEIEKYLPTQVK